MKMKHLIVISFDGLSTLDFDELLNLPNFRSCIQNGAFCRQVYSVYPSLTYPAHATIVTGKYPKNHGIVNNTLLQPDRSSPDWYWYRKAIQGDTFYDLAIQQGKEVAALLWPTTGRSAIQFNLPEIFPNRPWHNQVMVSLLSGSPIYQFILNHKFGQLRKGLKQPELDHFVHESFLYTLKHKRQELSLVHYTDLDSMRHQHGFFSKEAAQALQRHDKRLGDILNTLREMKVYKESTLILLGDHSSIDEDKVIRMNVLLREKGYIDVDRKGRILTYDAIAKKCDGSAYVYTRSCSEQRIMNLQEAITEFQQKTGSIEEIHSREDAVKMGADPACTFMLEAARGYYFEDGTDGDAIVDLTKPGMPGYPHYTKATHGYSPFKEQYTTVFIAYGCGIRKNQEIRKMNLTDEGPTIAKLLGVKLKEQDGEAKLEFFE